MDMGAIEVRQINDSGAGLLQNVLRCASVLHPLAAARARVLFVQRQLHRRQVGPIAGDVHTTRSGAFNGGGDIPCSHRVLVHAISWQADAVEYEVTALDGASAVVGLRHVGGHPLLDRVGEQAL